MRDLVGRRQHSDNLNKNRRNRSYHGISFRHSDAFQRTPLTIDNLPLSIVLDTESQISDSQRPQPGKSRPPALRSTRGRSRCQPPALFRTPSAAPGGRYLVRGTRRRRPALAKSRSFSRAAVATATSGPLAFVALPVLLAIVLAGQVPDRRGTKRTDLAFGD